MVKVRCGKLIMRSHNVTTAYLVSLHLFSEAEWNSIRVHILGEGEVAQSCPTLWDPVDCSLPGSSVHGILQARILEWVAKVAQTVKRLSTMRETRV